MAARYEFGVSTNLGNIADPVFNQDAATKAYVDTHSGGSSTVSVNGTTVTNPNFANSTTTTTNLGITYTNPSGSTVNSTVLVSDVATVADKEIAAKIGSDGTFNAGTSIWNTATSTIVPLIANATTVTIVGGNFFRGSPVAFFNYLTGQSVTTGPASGSVLSSYKYMAVASSPTPGNYSAVVQANSVSLNLGNASLTFSFTNQNIITTSTTVPTIYFGSATLAQTPVFTFQPDPTTAIKALINSTPGELLIGTNIAGVLDTAIPEQVLRTDTTLTKTITAGETNSVTIGVDLTKEAGRIDTEIAAKIGSITPNLGTQISDSTTTLTGSNAGWTIVVPQSFAGGTALAQWQTMTGSTATTLPTAALPPLPKYAYTVVNLGNTGNYSTVVPITTVQVPLSNAAIVMVLPATADIFNNSTFPNNVYYGDSNFPNPTFFTFQPPPLAAIDREIAANSVNSLDGLQGNVTLVAGTGIGLANSVTNKTITITNTGSGSGVSAGNTVTFVNNQHGEKVLLSAAGTAQARYGYIKVGFTTDTEDNDGGYLNGVKYIGTFNSNFPPEGFGVTFPVATTYSTIETIFDIPAYTVNLTTSNSVPNNGFQVLNALFSKSTSLNTSQADNPASYANLFPGFSLGQPGTDDQALIPLVSPTLTVTGSGTSWTLNIGASRWSGIANNYTHTAASALLDYTLFLPIYANSGATGVPFITSATVTRSTFGGVRVFVSLPGTGGALPTLQQVLNTGNSATNTSGNVASIIFTDSTTSKTTTLSASNGLETGKIKLDGTTSGSITVDAPATTNTYTLTLPATQGNNGQQLTEDGSGNLAWYNDFDFIQAVSTVNVATLSGSQTVDGYTTAVNDLVLLTNQDTTSQNGLYEVAASAWVKQTTYNTQKVFAQQGILNQFTTWGKSSTTGDETWVAVSLNARDSYETGYKVTGTTSNVLNMTKIDGSNASASDFAVGEAITADGVVTAIPLGQMIVIAVGTATGPNLSVTLHPGTVATFNIGSGVRRLPRVSSWNFPFVSTVGGGTGLAYGAGLTIDTNGKLAATNTSSFAYTKVQAISTTNIGTISGLLTIDGYQTVAGDLVLLQNQTTASQNGIYTVASGAWTGPATLVLNQVAQAQNGTANIGKDYIQTSTSNDQSWSLFAVSRASTSGSSFAFNTVKAVATSNVTTLSGLQIIDGYQTVAGDTVLLQNQTTTSQNGIYTVASGAWTGPTTLVANQVVQAQNGTTGEGKDYIQTATTGDQVWILFAITQASGVSDTLDQVLGEGNTSTKNLILTGAGLLQTTAGLQLNGSTSGSLTLKANGTTTAYSLSFPAAIGANGQTLITDASGNLTWGVSNLQAVVNSGNSITNTTGNTGSIVINDDTSGKATTITGLNVEAQQLQLDGSTSGNVKVKANAVTTAYTLTLPNAQASANQILSNDGAGALSWVAQTTPGIDYTAIKAISTTNVASISGLLVIDGYQTVAGDVVLLQNQTTASQNGLYTVAAAAWSGPGTTVQNKVVQATSGTANINRSYIQTASSGNQTWVFFSSVAVPATPTLQQVTVAGATSNVASTFSGGLVSSQAPVNANDVARLADVQAATAGFKPQDPVRLVSTVSVGTGATQGGGPGFDTVFGTAPLVIDGVTPVANDKVLLVNQDDLSALGAKVSNGEYNVTSNPASGTFTLTRTTIVPAFGNTYAVREGTQNINSIWENVTTPPITVGTTPILFAQFGLSFATPNLQLVTNAGNSTTNAMSVGGILTAGNGSANYTTVTGAAASSAPIIRAAGSDTNINLAVAGKGTGGLQLGTTAIAVPLFAADAATQTAITAGSTGQVLTSAGSGKTPYWATISTGSGSFSYTSVAAVSTTNIATLSGIQLIDGYLTVAGDKVLLQNQTTASQNGIYTVAAGAWTGPATLSLNQIAMVKNGVTNANSNYIQTASTGNQVWTIFTSGSSNQFGTQNPNVVFAGPQGAVVGSTFTVNFSGTGASFIAGTLGFTFNSAAFLPGYTPTNGTTASISFAQYTGQQLANLVFSGWTDANWTITSSSGTAALWQVVFTAKSVGTRFTAPTGVNWGQAVGNQPSFANKGSYLESFSPYPGFRTLVNGDLPAALLASTSLTLGTTTGTAPLLAANGPSGTIALSSGTIGQSLISAGAGRTPYWGSGFQFQSVSAISTTNVASLSGLAVIDGYQTSAGNLVLLQNQTTASQNGIYTISAGNWTGPATLIQNQIAQAQSGVFNIQSSYIQVATTGNQVWNLYVTSSRKDNILVGANVVYAGPNNLATFNVVVNGTGATTVNGAVQFTFNNAAFNGLVPVASAQANFPIPAVAYTAQQIATALFGSYSDTNWAITKQTGDATQQILTFTAKVPGGPRFASAYPTTLNFGQQVTNIPGGFAFVAKGAYTEANSAFPAFRVLSNTDIPAALTSTTSFSLGDLYTGTAGTTPLLAADVATGTVALSAGTAGQVLTSAGAGRTPYWAAGGGGGFNFTNVQAVSTANVTTISGLLIIDGYQTVAGDKVLLQNQTTASQNGIYTVANSTWTGPATLVLNQIAQAQNGTANSGRDYIQTAGSGNQVWQLFASTGNSNLGFNYANFVGATAGNTPSISVGGGDTNVGLNVISKGTGSINFEAPFTTTTGVLQVGINSSSYANFLTLNPAAANNPVTIGASGSDSNVGINFFGKGTGIIKAGTNFANYLTFTGTVAGSAPILSMDGSDTNQNIGIRGKGTGAVILGNNVANTALAILGAGTAKTTLSAIGLATNVDMSLQTQGTGAVNLNDNFTNFIKTTGALTNNAPTITATGTDTNVALTLSGKGTGNINLTTSGQVNVGTGTGNLILLGNVSGAASISTGATNQGLALAPNGTGALILGNTVSQSGLSLSQNLASAAQLTATGPLTNIGVTIAPKGNSNLTLATASASSVLIGQSASEIRLTATNNAAASITTNVVNGNFNLSGNGQGSVVLGNTSGYTGITVLGGQTSYAQITATGAASTIDLVMQPAGGGWFYPLGSTLSATQTQQPKIALATSVGATTQGAGVAGQTMISNGGTSAPYWGRIGGTRIGRVAAGTQFSTTNTILSGGTQESNSLPSYVSFSNGVLTNNSTVAITVMVSFTISLSATVAPVEVDLWIASGDSSIRYAQTEYPAAAWAGSGSNFQLLRSVCTPVPLGAGANLACFGYASSTVSTAANFGGVLTTSIFTVL